MKLIREVVEIDAAVAAVRHTASAYITNMFGDRLWLNHQISLQALSLLDAGMPRVVLILRQENSFTQLYFAAASPAVLSESLVRLSTALTSPLVVNIIGRDSEVTDMADLLVGCGFGLYERLRRMVAHAPLRIGFSRAVDSTSMSVTEATEADIEWVSGCLEREFDIKVDQLPGRADLTRLVAECNLIIGRVNRDKAGFTVFFLNGATAVVKYWYVDPSFRGYGIGSAMLQYVERAAAEADAPMAARVKRIMLWVKERNSIAIDRYLQYGFTWEGLRDDVYCMQKE